MPAAPARLEETLYELAYHADGPLLHIAGSRDETVDILVRAVRNAGRHMPIVACCGAAGDEPAATDSPLVFLGASRIAEIRDLPMRFGAVVIRAEPSPEALEAQLDVLRGKLMARAPVLLLDYVEDEAATGRSHAELALRERFASAALFEHVGAGARGRSRAPGGRPPTDEALEAISERLTQTEAAQAGLGHALMRSRGRLREITLGDAASERAADGPATVVLVVDRPVDAVAACIDSVLEHTPRDHDVLFVDSGADPEVTSLVTEHARRQARVSVLSAPGRDGYWEALGVAGEVTTSDLVLLSGDSVVAGGWIAGLAAVARSRADVATVIPVPGLGGRLPKGVGVAEVASLVGRLSLRVRPPAPATNPFCIYIRRHAIDRIPGLAGSDFAERAREAGYVNLVDDATYVDSPSAEEADEPASGPWAELRDAVDAALRKGADEIGQLLRSRPGILLVLHAGGGGTPETNRDLARALAHDFRCLTLSCDHDHWTLTRTEPDGEVELDRVEFSDPWEITEPLDAARVDSLGGIIEREGIDLVHVRSFIATGPELTTVVKSLGLPLVCSLHDFYTVCPTIQLLDEQERFCAGHCTPGPGPCPTSKRWVGSLAELKHDYVHTWRARMAEHLAEADAFVTTSRAAESVLVDHFGFMGDGRLRVIAHGRDAQRFRPISVPPGTRPRVVAFGALGVSKGTSLLRALLELDRKHGPAFEFHFLGPVHRSLDPGPLGGVVHGPYERDELSERLAAIGPSYALITSIWPETYCHTLTEAWLADLPVFASDIGTLRERIGTHGGGWLLDNTDPAEFYAGMRAVSERLSEWQLRRAEIARMEPRTVDAMAADFRQLYGDLLRRLHGARG